MNERMGEGSALSLQRVDKPHPCHSEEYPKGTCFAARSDVGIRIFSGRNLLKAQNLCVLETEKQSAMQEAYLLHGAAPRIIPPLRAASR